jgi:hypothetical protein
VTVHVARVAAPSVTVAVARFSDRVKDNETGRRSKRWRPSTRIDETNCDDDDGLDDCTAPAPTAAETAETAVVCWTIKSRSAKLCVTSSRMAIYDGIWVESRVVLELGGENKRYPKDRIQKIWSRNDNAIVVPNTKLALGQSKQTYHAP